MTGHWNIFAVSCHIVFSNIMIIARFLSFIAILQAQEIYKFNAFEVLY